MKFRSFQHQEGSQRCEIQMGKTQKLRSYLLAFISERVASVPACQSKHRDLHFIISCWNKHRSPCLKHKLQFSPPSYNTNLLISHGIHSTSDWAQIPVIDLTLEKWINLNLNLGFNQDFHGMGWLGRDVKAHPRRLSPAEWQHQEGKRV